MIDRGALTARHPSHPAWVENSGFWETAIPFRSSSLLLRWRIERACYRRGGHWWHPIVPSRRLWGCCSCGRKIDNPCPNNGARR